MTETTTNKQQIAWQFLQKNLNYQGDFAKFHTPTTAPDANFGFPCSRQTAADSAAQKWGLLSFCNPRLLNAEQRPFWSIAPTLEAEAIPDGQTPLLPMVRRSGAAISGLLLLDGDLILRIERGMKTAQLRIKNGRSFNEETCVALRLPVDLSLPVNLTKGLDLWNIVSGERSQKVENQIKRIMASCFASLTACLPKRAIAR
ncbi:MAG: transcriptional regulator domain-containing protein [Sphingomonadales bacterium]